MEIYREIEATVVAITKEKIDDRMSTVRMIMSNEEKFQCEIWGSPCVSEGDSVILEFSDNQFITYRIKNSSNYLKSKTEFEKKLLKILEVY
jgi:hypothetical protein